MAARGDAMEGDLAWAVSSLPILPSSGLSFLRTRSTASAPPQPQARNTCGSWLKASEVFSWTLLGSTWMAAEHKLGKVQTASLGDAKARSHLTPGSAGSTRWL